MPDESNVVPECTNDHSPADYLVTLTQVNGRVFTHPYCAECALGLGGWIFPNNDEDFAGVGGVVMTVTYQFLHAPKYQAKYQRELAEGKVEIGACESCLRPVTESDCYRVTTDTGSHLYCDDCPPA